MAKGEEQIPFEKEFWWNKSFAEQSKSVVNIFPEI